MDSLRASLKEETTLEIKGLLRESQNELLKLLKSKKGENVREESEENAIDAASRNLYTPTRSVKINPVRKNDPCTSRNNQ